MDDEFVLNSPEQLQALSHPTRHRILNWLVDHTATNQQIATFLNEPPARIHFHVRELKAAGLIVMVDERPKGGVLEKYYRAAARAYRLGPAFQFDARPRGTATEMLGLSLLTAAEQGLRSTIAGSPDGNVNPFIGAHFEGPLGPAAVARLQQLVVDLGEEFDRSSNEENVQPYTLTIVLHPQPASRPGRDADEESLD